MSKVEKNRGKVYFGGQMRCIMVDVQMANPTYFSLWNCFVLFQKKIQIIAIAVFKNCTKPERPSKNTSGLSVAMMYKICYRERFKQNFLILSYLFQN